MGTFSVTVRETYQRTFQSPVRVNYDVIRYLSSIEEVNNNIQEIERDLNNMNVIQKKTRVFNKGFMREIVFSRPNKIGTLIKTITVTKYNPPREITLV